MTAWATGRNETWHHLKKGFKHLSVEYAALGDKASQGVCVKFEVLQGITRGMFKVWGSTRHNKGYV